MALICLVLSGAALLVNGLTLLGRVPGRDSGVFNVLIGGLQLVLCVAVAVSADGSLPVLLGISGTFLFGVTYLYVGVDSLLGLGAVGLGWFCGLVAALAVAFAVVHVADDPFLAVLWTGWAALWALFFVLLALGRSVIGTYTGCLTGHWPTGSVATTAALLSLVGVFGGAALLTRRAATRPQPEHTPAPAAA
jgi:hypothetical protein